MQDYVSYLVTRWIHLQYINKEKKTRQTRWTPLCGATVVRYGQYLRMRVPGDSPMPICGAFPVSNKLYFAELLRQVRTCPVAWYCPHHTAKVPSSWSSLSGWEWYCYQVDNETSSVQVTLLFNDIFRWRMISAGRPPTRTFRVQTLLRSISSKIHFCLQNFPSRSLIAVMFHVKINIFLVYEVVYLMPVRQSELRIPTRYDTFLFPENVETSSGSHPAPISTDIGGSVPGNKATGAWS